MCELSFELFTEHVTLHVVDLKTFVDSGVYETHGYFISKIVFADKTSIINCAKDSSF